MKRKEKDHTFNKAIVGKQLSIGTVKENYKIFQKFSD